MLNGLGVLNTKSLHASGTENIEDDILSNELFIPEELIESEQEESNLIRVNAPYEQQCTNIEDMSPFERQVYEFYCLYKKRGYITEDEVLESNDSFSYISRLTERLLDLGVVIQQKPVSPREEVYDAGRTNYERLYKTIVEEFPELKKFIKTIRKIRPPQKNEWQQLIPQAKSGNRWAYERLIEMYLRVVVKTAWYHYRKYDMSFVDAIQDGVCGLMYAIEVYDITEHNLFTTFISRPIVAHIVRNCDFPNHTLFYIPYHIKENLLKIHDLVQMHQCQECLCGEKVDCETLKDEIMAKLNCSLEVATMFLNLSTEYKNNIYDLIDEDAESPFETYSQNELRKVIAKLLTELEPKEESILTMRFGLISGNTRTLEEVGEAFGITRERVRQMEQKALNRLKHPTRSRLLRSFLSSDVGTSSLQTANSILEYKNCIDCQTHIVSPSPSQFDKGWSFYDVRKLKKLIDKGLSASEIGAKLNKSKNAVIGKLHRLGWQFKE